MALRFRLTNGLTVVFEELHASRVAAFQIWVKVGSADERPDQAGLAHLHEHMLFKGTPSRGPGVVAYDIEAHGGEINAWTSFDQTVYHIVIASAFARHGLEVLTDAVRHSVFDARELEREIEVVCEEIKRSRDVPSRRASHDLFGTAYGVHPYRKPVLGTAESVRSFTRERMLDFYRAHYRPENMVLAVAGDLTEGQLRDWAEALLGGDWRSDRPELAGVAPLPVSQRSVEPALASVRTCLRPDDVKETYLNLAFQIPAVNHADVPALDLLSVIAGQGDASRLNLEVKRRRSLVNDIHTFSYTPQNPGIWVTSMTTPSALSADAFEHAVQVLGDLKRAPVETDELATVKALVESEAIYQRETVQGLARKLGYYETAGGGIEAEATYHQRIAALSAQELLEVARRYFTFDRAVVTGLLPEGASGVLDEAKALAILERAAVANGARQYQRRVAPAGPTESRVTRGRAAPRWTAEGGTLTARLNSGATVIVREERNVPLFAIRAVFPGGLRYESNETNGLTTLLTRTWTRGTGRFDAEQISNLVDDLNGSLSGVGGRNSLSLRGEFLSRHFRRAFDLFVDVLRRPAFPEAELARERKLLLQDLRTRDDKPSGVAFDLFAKALYRQHPYRLSLLGEAPVVERLTAADLLSYHQRHLDPSQLTLCAVGDVRADELFALAEEAFGEAGALAAPPPSPGLEPEIEAPRRSHRQLDRAQCHAVYGFHGARVTDSWRSALDVLSTALSGQGGRLFVELRDKQSLAYSVSSMSLEGIEPGYFAVYIGTSPEKLQTALDGIRQELAKLCEKPLSAEELQRAKRHLVGTHEIGMQRNGARAAVMALDHCYGLGANQWLSYASKVERVTADEVLEVARRVLRPERSALAVVGPSAEETPASPT